MMRVGLVLCFALLLVSLGAQAEEANEAKKTDREILQAGHNGVTNPELIPKTKKTPYIPRKLKGSGQVVLQVVIETDGTVGDISVIRCNRPGIGLEKSATKAVKKWRYKPAEKDGEPVAVYFIIVIEFTYYG